MPEKSLLDLWVSAAWLVYFVMANTLGTWNSGCLTHVSKRLRSVDHLTLT